MSRHDKWIWQGYFLAYLTTTAYQTWAFLGPDSQMSLYYHILLAFDRHFLIPYLCNGLSVLLNVAAAVPFYLYLTRIPVASRSFWQKFFFIRLIFDVLGRSYDVLLIKALAYQGLPAAAHLVAWLVLLSLPSYCALFHYAFDEPRTAADR